jgi:hypothetical protein
MPVVQKVFKRISLKNKKEKNRKFSLHPEPYFNLKRKHWENLYKNLKTISHCSKAFFFFLIYYRFYNNLVIFTMLGSNPGLAHARQLLYH